MDQSTIRVDHAYTDAMPKEDEVRLYEDRGYHIAPEIVPHDILDAIFDRIAAIQSGERDRALPANNAKFSDWKPGDPAPVRNNEFCSLQNDVVRDLAMLPQIGEMAARLARSAAARLFDDQLIYKPPAGENASATAVGWHTDGSYWSTCTSSSMLTAWIPLHDTSVENGTLYVIEGSHRWPESQHVRNFNDPDLDVIEKLIGRKVPENLIKPMILKKGQMSFHHMHALHASPPNLAKDRPRCAVALHMQDHDNAHQTFLTPDGIEIVLPHDKLCGTQADGTPDYSDPAVFPQIWPAVGGS